MKAAPLTKKAKDSSSSQQEEGATQHHPKGGGVKAAPSREGGGEVLPPERVVLSQNKVFVFTYVTEFQSRVFLNPAFLKYEIN